MKPYAYNYTGFTTHGHNDCGICCGGTRNKTTTRQMSRKEIETELFNWEFINDDFDDLLPPWHDADCDEWLVYDWDENGKPRGKDHGDGWKWI